MKASLLIILAMLSTASFSNDYQDAQAIAMEKLNESTAIMAQFNRNDIPKYTDNPNEIALRPSKEGELSKKAKQYIAQNTKAKEIYDEALAMKEQELNSDSIKESKDAYEKSNNEDVNVSCSSGDCVQTKSEQSTDFGEGAVGLGSLGDTGNEVREKQVHKGQFGVFKGGNITCRVVYREHRINCCGKSSGYCTNGEREISNAKLQGRAIRVPGGTYCSKRRRLWGCVQKRESWCIFQSKLAKIVQQQGRSQKGMSFGYVGGRDNRPNCRGLSPEEVSTINFETPAMKNALSELADDYAAKKKFELESAAQDRARERSRKNNEVINEI